MPASALNYKHLHYFWIVAKEGGISAAARKFGMTAQTISGQVALLEQEVGKSLFTQVGRKLELTDAGRTVLHYADRIFLLGDELQQAMERAVQPRTRLNVGILESLPKSVIQQLLTPLLANGNIRLVCQDGSLDDLSGKLATHQLDLVLADRAVASGGPLNLASQPLVFAPIMLLGTRALAEQYGENFPESINGAPLLLPTRNMALRLQLDAWFTERDLHPDIVGEFSDSALMHTFAKSGIGLYPSPVIASKPIPIADIVSLGHLSGVVAQYHAIYSPQKILHPAIKQLLDN